MRRWRGSRKCRSREAWQISDAALRIAGIGASAGGLEAMLQLFATLPKTGRIAYIVAQHMAHDGHSELVVRLLGRASTLPVSLARDGEVLQPDRIYVIPAGCDGHVGARQLALRPPAADNISTPSVNVLFESLAAAQGARAIGILLSGTGMDGARGCRAIKDNGGLTIAQAPADARFDGMPGAAIAAAGIDRILPVMAMGAALAAIFPDQSPAGAPPAAYPRGEHPAAISTEERRELDELLPLVFAATGIDFSSYKEDTLLRRLGKRKATVGIADATAYRDYCQRHPAELQILQQMFLVSVSSFFRDRASFEALERALAALLLERRPETPFQVWVPGCATGDEAYTLAIIFRELLGTTRPASTVRIIGSDLNPEALAIAAAGLYRQTACTEMDAALLEKYFIAKGQHVAVDPALREMIRFERRDVLSGSPPGQFDLISCRNLLIYMKSHLQEQLVRSFHAALRSHGLLFIGQAESLGLGGPPLFTAVDYYHRLYRRLDP